MKVLGVIPARGGSKTIHGKNLKILVDKPLIAYVIEESLKSKLIDRVIVSTDDKEIAKIARVYGAEVPFMRPSELARDEVSIIPVIQHAINWLNENEDWKANIVASIQPTSPLIEANDIDDAIKKLINTGCDSVVTVCRIVHGHPYWAMKLEGDKLIPLYPRWQRYLQKQDLPHLYEINGAIFVRKKDVLESWDGKDFALGKNVRAIVMDELKSIDVDTLLDFLVAETLVKMRQSAKK